MREVQRHYSVFKKNLASVKVPAPSYWRTASTSPIPLSRPPRQNFSHRERGREENWSVRRPIQKADRDESLNLLLPFPSPSELPQYIKNSTSRSPAYRRFKTVALGRLIWNERYSIGYEAERKGIVNTVGDIWDGTVLRHLNPRKRDSRMKSYVEILSTPTADTPGTSLMLHFNQKYYMIGNCSEGTQRTAAQRGAKVSKVSDIFLTGPVTWKNMGGLVGMVLTIADSCESSRNSAHEDIEAKIEKERARGKDVSKLQEQQDRIVENWVNIHGGQNLTHTLATTRRFIFRKGTPLHTQEFRAGETSLKEDFEPTWQDDMIRVWAMVVEPEKEVASPLKRTHDEFASDAAALTASQDGEEGTASDRESMDDQIRKGVVADMFNSRWKLDTLVSTKLSQLKNHTGKIFQRVATGIIEYTGPSWEGGGNQRDIEVLVRNPWPGALIENLPSTKPVKNSVCYIIKNYAQRGKFDPKAAIALGLKPPQFKLLAQGDNVVTDAGVTITPDQVLGPGREGQGFAVVDLPNISYVENLIAQKEWSTEKVMVGVNTIFWILGPGVVEDSRLQDFMRANTKLKHIVSSTDVCPNNIAMESATAAAIRLHLVDPQRFPIPAYNNKAPLQNSDASSPFPFQAARAGKQFILSPEPMEDDKAIVPYLDTIKVIKEHDFAVSHLAKEAHNQLDDPEFIEKLASEQSDLPCKDAEVFALGTGSMLPSKYRNVSATLVRVPGSGSYLFDCGENTLGQLKRVFGNELPDVLRDLKAIWISHLHADHHLGTVSVIKAWHDLTNYDKALKDKKLLVASEICMHDWLKEYADVEDFGYGRVDALIMGVHPSATQLRKFTAEESAVHHGIASIASCQVNHCKNAMAVAFTLTNGFKVAYSGDCRPSDEFVVIGKNATLLIHEATFDDELSGDARAKKHCTTSEALSVGREMGARRILLTHFSQRYQKIQRMNSEEGKDQVAIVAFDYMRCRIGDFSKVAFFLPALEKLYEGAVDGN